MAGMVHKMLEERGMRVIVGRGVEEILGTEKATGVLVAGEEIPADLVVVATDVRANTELTQKGKGRHLLRAALGGNMGAHGSRGRDRAPQALNARGARKGNSVD